MSLLAFLFLAAFLNPVVATFGDKENPFRMKKLNIIWRKAQNKMSEKKLTEFRRLLEMQDRAELKWKELKANGGDEEGEREAILRRKFAHILEEFGLDKHLDLVHDKDNEIKDNTAGKGIYGDRRLNELWNSAVKQGNFASDELEELRTEFNHHREKVNEYNDLLRVVMDHEGLSENSVLSQHTKNDEELGKLRDQLQDAHMELTRSFARLKEKATGEEEEKVFNDPRVNELWEKAKKGGFTKEELESIKEELDHFDHKIMKHEYYKSQAKQSHKLIKEGHTHLKEKHDTINKKAQENAKWVKKMHATLMDRVTRNEL